MLSTPYVEDAWLTDVFTYGKSSILLLTYFMDPRVLAWYAVINLLLYLHVSVPTYGGPTSAEWLTPAAFNEHMRSADRDGVTWLVMFYADWSSSCAHLDPTFADLSTRFTTPKLRFARLDLGRWPETAKQFSINLVGGGLKSESRHVRRQNKHNPASVRIHDDLLAEMDPPPV